MADGAGDTQPQGEIMRLLAAAVTAMLGIGALAAVPTVSHAQSDFGPGLSVGFAPPPLPLYDQPPIPDYGYIWIPGYWAWDPSYGDYYWVPGTWAQPPGDGLLWTPAWWGWTDGFYLFHSGYWAPYIGYYGGIDYGFGYTGYGYQGGYWRGREFFYNRAVNNVRNVRITNVFERPVIGSPRRNRVSYNGGVGGVVARPTPQQITAMRERHVAPTGEQARHIQAARADRSLFAKANHGAPSITATPRPAMFAPNRAPTPAYNSPGGAPPHAGHPVGPSPVYRPGPPAPNNPTAHATYPGNGGPSPSRPQNHQAGGPPAYHPPSGAPGGFAPPPRPQNYPATRPNYPGNGGPQPPRPQNPQAGGPTGYHPPSGAPGGFAPPPRQAPPPQAMRAPPPPPQHSGDPKDKPH